MTKSTFLLLMHCVKRSLHDENSRIAKGMKAEFIKIRSYSASMQLTNVYISTFSLVIYAI